MQTVEALFADYASYHRTKGNKVFHRLGIPLIVFSAIGMLAHVTLFDAGTVRFDAAMLLIGVSSAWYFVVEWRLAIAMMVVSIAFYFGGVLITFWIHVALHVIGWIFQGIGHAVYEHKSPAFLRNLTHLLVGPLWILNDVIPVVKKDPGTTVNAVS